MVRAEVIPPPGPSAGQTAFPAAAGWFAAAVGAAALIGWVLDVEPLKRLAPGLDAINPQVAVTTLIAGACVALRARTNHNQSARRAGHVLAALVLMSGALRLLGYLAPSSIRLDTLLFTVVPSDGFRAARMAPNAALICFLLGAALLLVDVPSRRRIRPAQALALAATGLSFMPLVAYLYSAAVFQQLTTLLPMALQVAAVLFLLSMAVLRLRPDTGLTLCLTGGGAAGAMARRLIPAAVAVPVIVAALRVGGERAGLYGTEFGVAIMVICNISALLALIWWTAWSLHQGEAERRRLTERAESAEREQASLKQAVAAMEQVLGVVGHELRTPLAAMRLTSELLQSDGVRQSDDCASLLESINREAVRMAGTVNDLLEAARLNSGLATWNWSQFPPGAACEEALGAVRQLLDPSRVTLTLTAAPGDFLARGDADAFQRLVINLAGNARRFTEVGRIDVGIRPLPADEHGRSSIELTVRDTGCGISPEIRDRLGEAFALNAGIVGDRHVTGAGLGLAICRGIVAAHGGMMSIESEVGKGTCVTVRLRSDLRGPIMAAPESSQATGPSPAARMAA